MTMTVLMPMACRSAKFSRMPDLMMSFRWMTPSTRPSRATAGMSRLNAANVLATSGRAVEAAGDVDVLLLDKTGTINGTLPKLYIFSSAPA